MYSTEMKCGTSLTESIDILYEKGIEFLMKHSNCISASEKGVLTDKFNKLSTIVSLGIRTGQNFADAEINSDVFQNFKINFQKRMPLSNRFDPSIISW